MKLFIDRVNRRLSHIPTGEKIAIALSGGVDSSVSAFILKELGYTVKGFYMQNWLDPRGNCHGEADWQMVESIGQQLDIPVELVNFSDEYWQSVFSVTLQDYARHITPNPDILCNREIKFSTLQRYTQNQGFKYLATGHYANIIQQGSSYQLQEAIDLEKDQTYFLCALTENQIQHSIFPLGDLYKTEVKQIAKTIQLPNFDRKESMGICFIEPKHFKQFLMQYIPKTPGNIVDKDGHILGQHDGLSFYTIGQRQGLGIGGHRGLTGPWYVVDKLSETNELIVATQRMLSHYNKYDFCISPYHFINKAPEQNSQLQCKLRHGGQKHPVTIALAPPLANITLEQPRSDIASGQWAVFYDQTICIGGGQIQKYIL